MAYFDILKGIKLVKEDQHYVSVLSVINAKETPQNAYEFYKKNKIDELDLLLPDKTYDDNEENEIGDWVNSFFDLWFNDCNIGKPSIRIFDILINLILGNKEAGNDVWGRRKLGVVEIKTNGKIDLVDSMETIKDLSVKTNFNILFNTFDDINESAIFNKYYLAHQDDVLCDKCKKCIIKEICGGGLLTHRFSSKNGFENPSCYCNDIIKIVVHVQNELYDKFNLSQYNCEKLTETDFI